MPSCEDYHRAGVSLIDITGVKKILLNYINALWD